VQRATLSNGIPVVYARRAAVPVTRVVVEFNAGAAADPSDRLGTQRLTLNLMEEGTTRLNSVQLAEAQERLGATINTGFSLDRTDVSLTALTPALGASLDLLADVIRNPAFAPGEVERLRQQQLAQIAQEMTQPQGLATRALPVVLYGAQHPYGKPGTGTGDAAAVRSVTRDELVRFHQTWIRPDNATIFAVGDLPLDEFVRQLESRLGNWRAPAVQKGTKRFDATPAQTQPRIVLIDRPQSPQSFILAGQLLPVQGTQDTLPLTAGNQVLGGDFLARINMELREKKGWSYGAFGSLGLREHQVPYIIQAPVQSDRTGDSIRAMMEQVNSFLGPERHPAERAGAGDCREHRPASGPVRDLARGAGRASLQRPLPPPRQLLGDRRRSLSRHDRAAARSVAAAGGEPRQLRLGRGGRCSQGPAAACLARSADRGDEAGRRSPRRCGGCAGHGFRRAGRS
jgi:predicted Zn-dependent peptidase